MYNVIVYEDKRYPELYPLTCLRPVWDLKCGAFSLKQHLERAFKSAEICQWASRERSHFSGMANYGKGPVLLINGRAYIPPQDLSALLKARGKAAIAAGGLIAALKLDDASSIEKNLSSDPDESLILRLAQGAREIPSSARIFRHLWEMVDFNGTAIMNAAGLFKPGAGNLCKGSYLLGKRSDLRLSARAAIEPGVVIDVRHGPVIIEAGAAIRPFSFIEGPCYLGPDALIDGAKLRPGVSAGRGCKLAGEIEESVILDFSNKHHEGFLGHSYLGNWVNLGAMTTNSDLKNNYGSIAVWANGKYTDTGSIKAGCYIGDHSKTAIGTMINTGAVIGVCCSVFGGAVRKHLPSFAWGNSDEFFDNQLDKAVETCRTVMARRGRELSPTEERLIRKLYQETAFDRRNLSGGRNR
jgi:UDP-N-acetylglucosamine diphosphorylase/glucosamine-1-phosphate N-acetyltransferase